jgi:capsular polysaccharide biosynthesis protein
MLFASADLIVTEFGAAMANVMFCRPGTRVVEIIAEGQHDPWSAHLCAMLELDHAVLFQKQSEQVLLDHPRHAKDSEFEFSVDIEQLVERVETLIGND